MEKKLGNLPLLLVVDDEPINLRIISEELKEDFLVITCSDGFNAIELAEKQMPEIILLDIMMPEMDGYQVCRELKKNPQTKDIPIIFLTALTNDDEETLGFEVGAVDYITKPVSFPILKARVQTHLELNQYRQQLENLVLKRTKELLETNMKLQQEIHDRKRAEESVRLLNTDLENRVNERTALLKQANIDLENEILIRKKYEQALIAAKKEAETANHIKTQFIHNISHEISPPLTMIIGMAEQSALTDLNEEQRSFIETIHNEANILSGMVNDMLDFSRIENGVLQLDHIPFDLKYLIEDISSSIAFRAEQRGVKIISFLSPELPTRFYGDPGRLRQIIINLTGNALKYTPEGEILIKAELVNDDEKTAKIIIRIKDTGIGIPVDRQKQLFNYFDQVEYESSGSYKSAGMGTTIAKKLVELMSGDIGFETCVNKGSTFWFTVILKKQMISQSDSYENSIHFKDLRVLLIDDNHTNRFVLNEYLTSWGGPIIEMDDGTQAIQKISQSFNSESPINLILLDNQISTIDGFGLAKKIKDNESFKQIPMIVFTAISNRGDGKLCRDMGIEGYLTKPIRQDELKKAIFSIMGFPALKQQGVQPGLITRHSLAEQYGEDIHILLVEDYPANQDIVKRYLESSGFYVMVIENGQKAVEAFKKNHYDLILMDTQLPLLDGYAATKAIRILECGKMNANYILSSKEIPNTTESRHSTIGRVPIIAMTTHAFKGYREKCLKSGMDDYIVKPVRHIELINVVNKWTRKRKTGAEIIAAHIRDKAVKSVDNETQLTVTDPNDIPIIINSVLKDFDGNMEVMLMTLMGFLRHLKNQVETIENGFSQNNMKVIQNEAHAIKGGASNLFALKLAEYAEKIENFAATGKLDSALTVFDKLKYEMSRLDEFAEFLKFKGV